MKNVLKGVYLPIFFTLAIGITSIIAKRNFLAENMLLFVSIFLLLWFISFAYFYKKNK